MCIRCAICSFLRPTPSDQRTTKRLLNISALCKLACRVLPMVIWFFATQIKEFTLESAMWLMLVAIFVAEREIKGQNARHGNKRFCRIRYLHMSG